MPVPKLKSLVPVYVKLPFHVALLLLDKTIAPPLVLSMVVPGLIVNAPVPSAVALLILRVPAFSLTAPEKVLAPLKLSVPGPDAVKAVAFAPLLAITEEIVRPVAALL